MSEKNPEVEILPPGGLQVERLDSGLRMLIRPLRLVICGEELTIPMGFITDYSSWPRFLPGPAFHKIDIAGVVHDALFRWGTWGIGGRKVSFLEANRIWFIVARAGSNPSAKASWFWAWCGRAGLFCGSWPIWMKLRRKRKLRLVSD